MTTIKDLNDEEIKDYAKILSILAGMNLVEITNKLFMIKYSKIT